MPFKTRRQKESAQKRRYTLGREISVSYRGTAEVRSASAKSDLSNKEAETSSRSFGKRITETTYTGHDLLKIITLAGLIILAQALLRLTLH